MSEVKHDQALTTPVGHLSVHIEGEHPVDVPFMFERAQKRAPGAGAASVAMHGVFLVIVLAAIHYHPTGYTEAVVKAPMPKGIIWIAEEGPGGGGGGGGNQMKLPPRKAELPGKDQLTVPVTKPKPAMEMPKEVAKTPEPVPEIPQLAIPAKLLAQGAQTVVGTLDGVPGGPSRGSGNGPGAGTGTGTGVGSGQGGGLGEGWGPGGTGGGPYRPGSGITLPKPLRDAKPAYTAEAMRAKIQGTAIVEAVVLPDGTVGDVQIVKSLDSTFGLDQEAIKAAKQWRFVPGTRNGQPVPVLVTIELTFTLR